MNQIEASQALAKAIKALLDAGVAPCQIIVAVICTLNFIEEMKQEESRLN